MTNDTHPELFAEMTKLRDRLNAALDANYVSDSNADMIDASCDAVQSLIHDDE